MKSLVYVAVNLLLCLLLVSAIAYAREEAFITVENIEEEMIEIPEEPEDTKLRLAREVVSSAVCAPPTRQIGGPNSNAPQLAGNEFFEIGGKGPSISFYNYNNYVLLRSYSESIFINIYNNAKFNYSIELISYANLKDLSPRIKYSGKYFTMECSTSKCWKQDQYDNTYPDGKESEPNRSSKYLDSYQFEVCDERAAERISKGLSFIIRANGGVEPPF